MIKQVLATSASIDGMHMANAHAQAVIEFTAGYETIPSGQQMPRVLMIVRLPQGTIRLPFDVEDVEAVKAQLGERWREAETGAAALNNLLPPVERQKPYVIHDGDKGPA